MSSEPLRSGYESVWDEQMIMLLSSEVTDPLIPAPEAAQPLSFDSLPPPAVMSLSVPPPPASAAPAGEPAGEPAGAKRQRTQPQPPRHKRAKLKRNRESARACRQRKKQYVDNLQLQVARLEADNLSLKVQLTGTGPEAADKEDAEKLAMERAMEAMLAGDTSDAEFSKLIDQFKERYSDYGRDRRHAVLYHLEQLERLLLPTNVTRVALTALDQDEAFFSSSPSSPSSPASGSGLGRVWNELVAELRLTPEQQQNIIKARAKVRALNHELSHSLQLLYTLRDQVASRGESLDSQMDQIQAILSPRQQVRFILWITHNPACMHMLDRLWKFTLQSSVQAEASTAPAAPAASAPPSALPSSSSLPPSSSSSSSSSAS